MPGRIFRTCTLIALGLAVAQMSRAQTLLVVEHDGKGQLVRAASGGRALIEIKDKLVVADGRRFFLKKTDEYAPAFVSVRKVQVRSSHVELMGTGAEINQSFQFRAEFESPYNLKRVFLVLELDTEEAGKGIFLWEVGDLKPRRSVIVDVAVPVSGKLGPSRYKTHLFSDGLEIFHSLMPFTAVESALDRMIARRVKDLPDGAPKPFVGPTPEYPAKLLKAHAEGEVTIALRVAGNGRVLDPVVKKASTPEFGEAALVAIRQWRFLPKIEKGRPVETKVEMPFVFTPPEDKK